MNIIIIALVILLICGYTIDIPDSLRTSIKERGIRIETRPLGRQLRLYQINNPQDCRIQHVLTKWFNAGFATFPNNSKESQKFYLGIKNLRKDMHNINNPQVILSFYNIENMEVDMTLSEHWEKSDPEGAYFIKIKDELQPSKLSINSLPALFIKFKDDCVIKAEYEIKIDNLTSENGIFHIYVGNPTTTISHHLLSRKEKTSKSAPSAHVSTSTVIISGKK